MYHWHRSLNFVVLLCHALLEIFLDDNKFVPAWTPTYLEYEMHSPIFKMKDKHLLAVPSK